MRTIVKVVSSDTEIVKQLGKYLIEADNTNICYVWAKYTIGTFDGIQLVCELKTDHNSLTLERLEKLLLLL